MASRSRPPAPVPQESQVGAALARIPGQSSAEIRQVRENAQARGAAALVAACGRELALRGGLELTAERAKLALAEEAEVAGLELAAVVERAFARYPARDDEKRLLQVIDRNGGAAVAVIRKLYGGRDAAQVAGHLLSERAGFFRRFLAEDADRASILLIQGTGPKQELTWTLKPEARAALQSAGVL